MSDPAEAVISPPPPPLPAAGALEQTAKSWFGSVREHVEERLALAHKKLPPATSFELDSLFWLAVMIGGAVLLILAFLQARRAVAKRTALALMEEKED